MKPKLAAIAILSTGFSAAVAVASVMAAHEGSIASSDEPRIDPEPAYRAAPVRAAGTETDEPQIVPSPAYGAPVRVAGTEYVFPARLRRFAMICDVHSEVSGDPAPEDFPSTPALTADPWDMTWHINVDLDRMQSCRTGCAGEEPSRIAAVDAERILLEDRPGEPEWVRRSDGAYYHRLDHGGRIVTTKGYCRRGAFTDFPVK